ncbi:DEAD/DEAH box helicase [Streptomyces sp. NPDC001795]|uniref:DEAD/DEAH box helicase n=1 Tax=Streptomyces sp. NPDC001795 TaxID=3154525 RepID=UPI00332C7E96
MGINWDDPGSWVRFAGALADELADLQHLADAKSRGQDNVIGEIWERLGKCKLWGVGDAQLGKKPDDPVTAGQLFAAVFTKVAHDRWQEQLSRLGPGQKFQKTDKPARFAYYLWAKSTLPGYVSPNPRRQDTETRRRKEEKEDKLRAEMGKHFYGPDLPLPHALDVVATRKILKAGRIPEGAREEDWKDFSSRVAELLLEGVEEVAPAGPEGPFRALTPAPLATVLMGTMGEHLNEMQQWALDRIEKVVENRSTMLITGPTGTGKSKIGQVALAYGAHRGASAVQVLPLKALVTQELNAWAQLLEQSGIDWRIVPGSRDFPQYDSQLARGNFDIALAIYETIGAYLAAGADPLARTEVLLVDELQHLADPGERGIKLEQLLTMIRLRPPDKRPALLGLSATVEPRTAPALRRWLGVSEVSPAPRRPVPMDTCIVGTNLGRDGKAEVLRQSSAHLVGTGEELPSPERGLHEWASVLSLLADDRFASLGTAEKIAVGLVQELLEENPSRRIIVFTPSRSVAGTMAEALEHALHASSHNRRLPHRGGGNPWQHGRFASRGTRQHAAERFAHLKVLQRHHFDQSDQFTKWLRDGIAVHTAQLMHPLRREIEQEFRAEHSLLRVLVATDTLAVGLNLPADIVINTRLTGYIGRGIQARLSPAELENKAGRAGRLGLGGEPRGRFYLLTACEQDVDHDRNGNRISEELADELRELTSPRKVMSKYVLSRSRTAEVRSHYQSAEDMARLVFAVLCNRRRDHAWRGEALLTSINEVMQATLRAAEIQHETEANEAPTDGPLPQAREIRNLLHGYRVLHAEQGIEYVTALGLAVGRSGLPLSATDSLEEVARLAAEEAHTLELLFEAARAPYIHQSVQWPAIPRRPDNAYEADLIRRLTQYASVYLEPSVDERMYTIGSLDVPGNLWRAAWQEPETVRPESGLGQRLHPSQPLMDLPDGDALLRALIAYEWCHGDPFGHMKKRMEAVVRPDLRPRPTRREEERRRNEQRRSTLRLYTADVIHLAEQLGGLLTAAAEAVDPAHPLAHRRLRSLASTVINGLPSPLVPLANLRIPALPRERLIALAHDVDVHDEFWEDMTEVLRRQEGLPPDELERVQLLYARRRSDPDGLRHWLLCAQDIPIDEMRGSRTFARWLWGMAGVEDVRVYRRKWRELIESLGIGVSPTDRQGHQQWAADGITLRVRIPDDVLTGTEVAAAQDDVILCWRGMTDRAAALAGGGGSGPRGRCREPHEVMQTITDAVSACRARGQADVIPAAVLANLRDGTDPYTLASPPFRTDTPSREPAEADASLGAKAVKPGS